MKQARIFYSGMVQGVGFRYTVHRYATDLGLTGWVRNLPDGRVEVLVEGAQGYIEQLGQNLKNYFRDYICDKHMEISDAQGRFADFDIKV